MLVWIIALVGYCNTVHNRPKFAHMALGLPINADFLPFDDVNRDISLGEGKTPLIKSQLAERAEAANRCIYIPHGAVLGLDGLQNRLARLQCSR